MRYLTLQRLGVPYRELTKEIEAVATNGGRFFVQQIQLDGLLAIGKLQIENPCIFTTRPRNEDESKLDSMRSNLLGFDLLSCCANFNMSIPANFKLMTCQFLFRSDRLSKFCSNVYTTDKWVEEIEVDDAQA